MTRIVNIPAKSITEESAITDKKNKPENSGETKDAQPGNTEKTKFRRGFEKAIPIEESKPRMIAHIEKYYENKH